MVNKTQKFLLVHKKDSIFKLNLKEWKKKKKPETSIGLQERLNLFCLHFF